ncbi:cell wall hydrolase [Candidatus Odyssella thessalonicensis]|uniref:cell wall hydrolase n=1 Tax=Candidatus Odyssella thessalonicensis TaxID=84647 RepID=UPI000225C13A|nr:cell wall hydrolase [Candidatus Odyssella thessalonicensis]
MNDVQILARTIYGEARGEYYRVDGGLASLIAVGNVVNNRYKQQSWYGKTIAEVCQKPYQFSCWNPNDPNQKLITTTIMDPLFDICLDVADRIIKDEWPDLTRGCDHYHAASMATFPTWSLSSKPQLKIGQHIFYNLSRRHK